MYVYLGLTSITRFRACIQRQTICPPMQPLSVFENSNPTYHQVYRFVRGLFSLLAYTSLCSKLKQDDALCLWSFKRTRDLWQKKISELPLDFAANNDHSQNFLLCFTQSFQHVLENCVPFWRRVDGDLCALRNAVLC